MKALLFLIAFTITASAQQARQLSPDEFQKLDQEVKTRPVMIPKSAGATAPKPGTLMFAKSARIRVNADGTEQVSPCLEIPILFINNTDQLLDDVSRSNVRQLAQELIKRGKQEQSFSIAGHASAEGDEKRNEELSNLRALRIQQELRKLGVPAAVIISAEGFGSRHAAAKASAPEPQRQQDRRVLVVKEK